MKQLAIFLFIFLIVVSCKKTEDDQTPSITDVLENASTPAFRNVTISTDKAVYNPGDEVIFTIENSTLPASVKVKYKFLNEIITESTITGVSWKWQPPSTDFRGYIAEVYNKVDTTETIYATIAVDVSSNWTRFPRYGFLSKFGKLSNDQISLVIENLNRQHINGIQFYDWHNKHHRPLPITGSTPANSWKDIANRETYFSTVEGYITSAHNHNMKAMFYNLVYGALEDGEADGVNKEWYIFNDITHTNRVCLTLPKPMFASNIYLLDPSNTGWQQYMNSENQKVYQYLGFDGYHMDQLGDWGVKYIYNGTSLLLSQTFKPFIESVKKSQPDKFIAMNAVNQYGQEGIAAAPSDFLYTEVWDPDTYYSDLASVIKENNSFSNNQKNTVLAAYINYALAENPGYFNTASVLMANSIIFAFGGAHLELGEHMLGKEYFPNSNLEMKSDLKTALVSYYDFLVAYQNLLRDGGSFNTITMSSLDGKMKLNSWPPSKGSVVLVGKKVGTKKVIHFINFKNSETMEWRDKTGVQVVPALIKNAKLVFTSEKTVKNIWTASPDVIGSASRILNFTQVGNQVNFTLPELKYWSMVVVEY
jgi:dextranase